MNKAHSMTDDSARFDELMALHEAMVWTLCLRMTGNRVLAQDAHQECFVRVWKALPTFRGEAKASTWIWRIAVRCCREILEGERRLPLQDGDSTLELLPDQQEDAHQHLEKRDATAFLLALLNPRERALVHLFYTQELSCDEVAEVMGMRSGAVRVALHRARECMRKGWEGAHGADTAGLAPATGEA